MAIGHQDCLELPGSEEECLWDPVATGVCVFISYLWASQRQLVGPCEKKEAGSMWTPLGLVQQGSP